MRTKKGIITSTKMEGTVTVTVHRLVFHPVYKKRYRKSKNFLCDSNKLDLYLGDKVQIEECRPLSKNKYFKVTEILKAAPRVSEMKEDKAVEDVLHREKTGADAEAKAAKAKAKEKDSKDAEVAEESEEKESSASSDSLESSNSSSKS